MSAILDKWLDTIRRSDCMRNDAAIHIGAPVAPAGFECVEMPHRAPQEQSLEPSEDSNG